MAAIPCIRCSSSAARCSRCSRTWRSISTWSKRGGSFWPSAVSKVPYMMSSMQMSALQSEAAAMIGVKPVASRWQSTSRNAFSEARFIAAQRNVATCE